MHGISVSLFAILVAHGAKYNIDEGVWGGPNTTFSPSKEAEVPLYERQYLESTLLFNRNFCEFARLSPVVLPDALKWARRSEPNSFYFITNLGRA